MSKHDCAKIVPGLGGFVTQYVSAQRVGSENLFLPPHRTVGFNQQLTLNDGLLVQSSVHASLRNELSLKMLKLIDNAVRQTRRSSCSVKVLTLAFGYWCVDFGRKRKLQVYAVRIRSSLS